MFPNARQAVEDKQPLLVGLMDQIAKGYVRLLTVKAPERRKKHTIMNRAKPDEGRPHTEGSELPQLTRRRSHEKRVDCGPHRRSTKPVISSLENRPNLPDQASFFRYEMV